ncbi:HU family DNA-binding protein [Aquisalimonas lutea]|uniref:HU family DNA-binding protein n=1 Tax=Aquisalimonas lutea TaxID=1327750 RepID=UPI0025B623E8|nr:HU family DNA-binding protein [Aquisalimonas lutea]MDN3517579.1 HU family DNA-binding protein [Aquisalimonas lutea]
MTTELKKSELIDKIAERVDGVTKKQIDDVLKALADTVTTHVQDGVKAPLPGLGKFVRTERSARQGRNPRTGQTVQIPAAKTPKFQPAKGFKDAVNG